VGEKADVVACVALRDCGMSEGSEGLEGVGRVERIGRFRMV